MTTTTWSRRFNFPFYTGLPAAAPQVPSEFPIALGGHPYQLYSAQEGLFVHETIPHQRPTNFTNAELGERALHPDAGWRVSGRTWHKGAGQRHLDLSDSDEARFWQSKGVDCWTKWQMTLLNGTLNKKSTANTNLPLVTAGSYLYVGDGQQAYWTTDLTTWTSAVIHHGLGPTTVYSLCSDGNNVFAALGANGISVTTRGAVVSTLWNGGVAATLVAWVKGRVMAAAGPAIYNPVLATTPVALFTHANSDFQWVGFADGDSQIYAAGYSGDKSELYRIGINTDGSSLAAPIISGRLPDGEVVTGLDSYLGFILIGTSKGVRTAVVVGNGDLRIGGLIQTAGSVTCFEGQDHFVWFGWPAFDSTSSGLGRMDLAVLNDEPAYASDLMATVSGAVTSVVTFNNKRVFGVAGSGVWAEDVVPVPTGFFDTGIITYDIADPKIAFLIITRHQAPLAAGAHVIALASDDNGFTTLGPVVLNGDVSAREARAEQYEVRHTFNPIASVAPILRRYTLLSTPAPNSAQKLTVPIHLSETQMNQFGQDFNFDIYAEWTYLTGLRDSRQVVVYQEGVESFTVTMTDYKWVPHDRTVDQKWWNGLFIAELTTVDTS